MSLSNANRFWFNQGLNVEMPGSTIISLYITKKRHEAVDVPKFDGQNGLDVLGNTIKKDLRSSDIGWGRSNGT
jgi:hypothetical protein